MLHVRALQWRWPYDQEGHKGGVQVGIVYIGRYCVRWDEELKRCITSPSQSVAQRIALLRSLMCSLSPHIRSEIRLIDGDYISNRLSKSKWYTPAMADVVKVMVVQQPDKRATYDQLKEMAYFKGCPTPVEVRIKRVCHSKGAGEGNAMCWQLTFPPAAPLRPGPVQAEPQDALHSTKGCRSYRGRE